MAQTYNANIDDTTGGVRIEGQVVFTDANPLIPAPLNATSPAGTVVSGALATQQLVSTTGAQINTTRDTNTYTAVTYDNSGSDATLKVELSPDNTTYSTLATITWKTFTGAVAANIAMLPIRVPAGWYIKLTTTNATLGLTTKA